MAPAQIPVFLSQKPSTEDGQFRVGVLRLAWACVEQHHGDIRLNSVNKDTRSTLMGDLSAYLYVWSPP